MSNRPFVISTDSGSDLNQAYCQENGVLCQELSYTLAGETYTNFDPRMTNKQFYDLVRQGEMPVTQQVNPQQFVEAWEPILQQGNDILHKVFPPASAEPTTVPASQPKNCANSIPKLPLPLLTLWLPLWVRACWSILLSI